MMSAPTFALPAPDIAAWRAYKFRMVNQGAAAVGRRSIEYVGHRYPMIGQSQFSILRRVGT